MKVLLIEDNPGDARLVQEMLKEAGRQFTLHIVARLGLALDFLSASPDVDVVLLDLGLPDSRGLETLTSLQTQFPRLPVVIMTGSDDEAIGAEAVQLGAQDYLVKGQVDSRLLRRALSYAIERRRVESEIKRLNEALKAHAEDLEVVNRDLRASNKEMEAFCNVVSHDLKAPLRHIEGFSDLVVGEYADKLDDQGKDYMQRIRSSSQKMEQLLDDLLHLSTVACADIEPEKLSLNRLAEEVAAQLKASRPRRHAEFAIEEGLEVSGDRRLLKQALQHLMGNAFKFTRNRPRAKIEVGAIKRSEDRIYFVRDNGCGFDMTYVNRLFQPFQSLHSHRDHTGRGVGLATVERIIHRHGGRIWGEGEVGKGATFFFTLREIPAKE